MPGARNIATGKTQTQPYVAWHKCSCQLVEPLLHQNFDMLLVNKLDHKTLVLRIMKYTPLRPTEGAGIAGKNT